MELIHTNPRAAAITTTRQPWAVAIRERYGALPDFASKFSPRAQKYCAQNMVKAVRMRFPSFGRIVITYGEAGIAALVATHITDAILRMGEDRDVDSYDVQFIAEAICQSERFRSLRFTTILGFFHLLKCGEFDIYGKVTPHKVLEALRKYADEAEAKENRILIELELEQKRRQEAEEAERIAREGNGWEAFKRQNGLDPNMSIAEYYLSIQEEASAKRREAETPLMERFLNAWNELLRALYFAKEYNGLYRTTKTHHSVDYP